MLTGKSPRALYDLAVAQEPNFGKLGVEPDGKLHALDGKALGLPLELFAGIGEHAIVVATGDRALGEKALGYTAGAKSPLLAMSMDYGRFLELTSQLEQLTSGGYADPTASMTADFNRGIAALYGRTVFTVDASDRGLRMWGSMELK
jgi:hypothetical protein